MRTTVTLEDDVVAALNRLEKQEGLSTEAINVAVPESVARRARFRTKTVDLGKCLVGSLDVVSEALALTEGDDFR